MLDSFPLLLRRLSDLIPAAHWTNRGTGAFSLIEQAISRESVPARSRLNDRLAAGPT
jgi:hypothetical protein